MELFRGNPVFLKTDAVVGVLVLGYIEVTLNQTDRCVEENGKRRRCEKPLRQKWKRL